MPLGMTVPTWYNDNHYISEKVDECNTIKFGAVEGEEFTPWTAQTVRDFMGGAYGEESYSPWMGYDNFVTSGNAENVSPNPLFDVMQYVYAKAAQLNAMNDGAGYGVNANNWTGQLVLDFFKANNISAWDHFTTAGQFERVNPSNAMDINAFLAAKAAQCNELQFDDKSDWTPDTVLDYYRANGLNAVEVANSANDPLVIPVADPVKVPTNLNPWGTQRPLNVVTLTTGAETVSDDGVPTNFVGTVETSNAKSTFNSEDQITGTSGDDVLTLTMNAPFGGMTKGGTVTGVSTIDLDNATTGDLTFNTLGIKGATTWNLDGNISLDNIDATGQTINMKNVNTTTPVTFDYAPGATAGPSDAVTLGLDHVYQPISSVTDQPMKAVEINSTGIETVTLDSTGGVKNMVALVGVNYMQQMNVKGDTALEVSSVDGNLQAIDASEATGALKIVATGANKLTSADLGSASDTLVVDGNKILPSATINGGDGQDNLVLQGSSNITYNFDMTGVETSTIQRNTGNVTINGADIEDMANLKLDAATSSLVLTDFNNSEMKVQAINANTSNLAMSDEITEVSIRVGDGDDDTEDSWVQAENMPAPNISLGSASTLNIDATDTMKQGAKFIAEVDAAKASNLNLNAGTDSLVAITSLSDLNNITHIDATGTGDIVIADGAVLGVASKQVNVNTTQMDDGSFRAAFANHTAGAGVLDVQGSGMSDNYIAVDQTYTKVTMTTGMGNDTLVLNSDGGTAWNTNGKNNLTVDLGAGNVDSVIVNGNARQVLPDGTVIGADFSNLKGVEEIWFTDADAVNWVISENADTSKGEIKIASNTQLRYGPVMQGPGTTNNDNGTAGNDTININVPDNIFADFVYGGAGGKDQFVGAINNDRDNVMLRAEEQPGIQNNPGSLDVNFVTSATAPNAASSVVINDVKNLVVETGTLNGNRVTGNVGNVSGEFILNTVTPGSALVNLQSVQAEGGVKVNAEAKGSIYIGQTTTNQTTGAVTWNQQTAPAVTTAGEFALAASSNVELINLGNIAASSVVLGTADTTENNVPTQGIPLANNGELNIGNITTADEGVSINASNTGALNVGTIAATDTIGGTARFGDITVETANAGTATFAGVTAGNDLNATVGNNGAFTLTNGANVNGDITIGATNTGNVALNNLDAGTATAAGNVDVSFYNGTAETPATAQIGTIASHNGTVEIEIGSNVSTLNVGAINAGSGNVTVTTANNGTTTLDGITTTGTATVTAGENAGATTLTAGNIGVLDYNGNNQVDTIGTAGTALTVGLGTDIVTDNGADEVYISNTATQSGTINVKTGADGDTVSVTANNTAAGQTTTVNIDLGSGGAGTETLTLATDAPAAGNGHVRFNVTNLEATDAVNGFDNAIAFDANYAANLEDWGVDATVFNGNEQYIGTGGNKGLAVGDSAGNYTTIYLMTGTASTEGSSLVTITGVFTQAQATTIVDALVTA